VRAICFDRTANVRGADDEIFGVFEEIKEKLYTNDNMLFMLFQLIPMLSNGMLYMSKFTEIAEVLHVASPGDYDLLHNYYKGVL
jgi:hypothetical protein